MALFTQRKKIEKIDGCYIVGTVMLCEDIMTTTCYIFFPPGSVPQYGIG